jgi:hypothetical protein
MSCTPTGEVWQVRWRDASGRQLARSFQSEGAARAFDEAMLAMKASERTARYGSSGDVYAYRTATGTRWRCAFKRSDGTWTSKRGFSSKRAAELLRRGRAGDAAAACARAGRL